MRKGIIVEIILIVLFVSFAVLMYNMDLDMIFFKIYTTKSLEDKKIEFEQKVSQLEATRVSHSNALNSLETAKSAYSDEKAKYDAISEETLSTINTATKGEEYNLEYMWVSLGNYAKQNNLKLVLYEPGAAASTSSTSTSTSSETDKNQTDSTTNTSSQDLASRSSQNLRVKVTGTYLNVSEFFYQLENDKELRFNLDNIRMEYLSNNDISAIFEVKGLILNK